MAAKSKPKSKPKKEEPKVQIKNVQFEFPAPSAQAVYLVGDFNQWDPKASPMEKDEKGVWKISLALKPGAYQYRFFVDGTWENDPACPTKLWIANEFGSSNCLKTVLP